MADLGHLAGVPRRPVLDVMTVFEQRRIQAKSRLNPSSKIHQLTEQSTALRLKIPPSALYSIYRCSEAAQYTGRE